MMYDAVLGKEILIGRVLSLNLPVCLQCKARAKQGLRAA